MPELFTNGDMGGEEPESSQPASGSPSDAPSDEPGSGEAPTQPPDSTDDGRGQPADGGDELKGSIPAARHKEILEHTRRQLQAETEALSWARDLDPQQVQQAFQVYDYYQRNPQGLLAYLQQSVQQPELPQPDYQTPDGAPLYSSDRMIQAVKVLASQIADERVHALESRLGPLEHASAQSSQAAQLEQQIEQASQLPGFNDHLAEITEVVRAANARRQRISLMDAYVSVVVPKLSATKEQMAKDVRKAVLAELNQTSERASDAVDPGRRPGSSNKPDSDKSWDELFEQELAKASAR